MLQFEYTISQRSKMTNNRIITLENKDISVPIDTFLGGKVIELTNKKQITIGFGFKK